MPFVGEGDQVSVSSGTIIATIAGARKMAERIADLLASADIIYALALRGQAELEEHELAEVNGTLVQIAEAAKAMRYATCKD